MDYGRYQGYVERYAASAAGQSGSVHTIWHRLEYPCHSNKGKGDLMHIDYPFNFDNLGRTAATTDDDHIRDLIEQVLFTTPGERVNRPTFGSGLMQLVFAPNSDALGAAVQLTVQGALQQWLGDLALIESVKVENTDSALYVLVQYVVKQTQQRQVMSFNWGGSK
jgi:uncharacterized protein